MDTVQDEQLTVAPSTHSLIGIIHTADVAAAARIMNRKGISALGVYDVDAKTLVGIITERDVSRCVALELDPSETTVRSAMSTELIVAPEDVTREEAAKLMEAGHVRHLLVADGEAIRILSMRDLS
jgi:CBS domain-containing protein